MTQYEDHMDKRIREMHIRMCNFPKRRKEIENKYNVKLYPQRWKNSIGRTKNKR